MKIKIKKLSFVFFVAIIVFGAALRGQETLSQNYLFLLDQGRDMMAVKRIVYDLHPTLIGPYTSLQGVFQGPLWYYLLAIPTVIFDGNPWGAVVLMFVISMSVVFVVYLFMTKYFGESVGMFTAFLFAVSPEAVAAATYTWNPHPMWLLILLYIFSFYQLVGLKNKKFHLVVWPLIALMFHFQTALAVFISIGSLLFLLFFYRDSIRQKKMLYGLILASVFFMPQVLFELRHDFLMTRSVLSIFSGSDQGLLVGGEDRSYLNLIQRNISLFYYNFSTTFVRDGYLKDLPKIALFTLVVSLLLQKKLQLFDKKEWSFIMFIVKIVGIIAILSFLYPFPLRYWFLTGFQSFYLVMFGIILNMLLKPAIGKLGIFALFGFLLFYSGQRLYYLYIQPPNDGGIAKIKGKMDALNYIYNDSNGKPFGLLVFNPPVSTDAYDYVLWWYGSRKYKYLPHQEKKGIFYLWIEQDSSKPWSYIGWLETVIKSGKVLETKTLPSGFIIQKRHN